MPVNNSIDPVYPKKAKVNLFQGVATAHNLADITAGVIGTDVIKVFEANDANNDAWFEELFLKAQPANNTALTLARFWLNNGSTIATAANSALFFDIPLQATTASATAPTNNWRVPMRFMLPNLYVVYMTIATAPGGSGKFSGFGLGGDC